MPDFGARMAEAARGETVGAAFLGAYRAAVEALTGVGEAALAVTEDGPPHPARVAARFADGAVTGTKRFLTGVPGARRAVVLAVAGEAEGGRRDLRAVVVELYAPGVRIEPMPPLPFVPDVPHAVLRLEGAPGRLLPGDGWADVAKPFRTVEDLWVSGAVASWLAARASPADAAALTALVGELGALAGRDPSSPETHLALDAVLQRLHAAVEALVLPDPAHAAGWARDRALLQVAAKARAARTAAARAKHSGLG